MINVVVAGELSQREAATSLGVTERPVRHPLASSRQQGVSAVVHGTRDWPTTRPDLL